MINFYSKEIYLISLLSGLFTYYKDISLLGSYFNYYKYISANTVISSQSQCETLCLNNAACKLYIAWQNNVYCDLLAYQNGVTSVSSSSLISILINSLGSITASRN
jgi:hypothetical protein